MKLADRLAAIAAAPDSANLAELLGVEAGALSIGADGLTVEGETVSLAEVRRALGRGEDLGRGEELGQLEDLGRRRVTIGDLCPTSFPS